MMEVETADGILTTNQGYELAEAKRLLSVSYVVKFRKVRVADYGSISHRHRVVLICILRDFPGANDFEMPAPTWGVGHRVACAKDVAISDEQAVATMDSKYFCSGNLATRYDVQDGHPTLEPRLQHGRMIKLGRVAPNMGHSSRPHLALSLSGTPNGPTDYGGGGIWPPMDFSRGGTIKWLRRFCSYDYYNISGTSTTVREWHATFTPGEDALIQGINQGFPTAVNYAIDTVLADILTAHSAVHDMPMGPNAENTYVTGLQWAAETKGGRKGGFATVPRWAETLVSPATEATAVQQAPAMPEAPQLTKWLTEEQCMLRMRTTDICIDWSVPLNPGKHATDRVKLHGDVSENEQVQAHYLHLLLRQLELENSTKVSYRAGVKKFLKLLNRGYPLAQLSADHQRLAETGFFEPAVWKPSEVETVLIDTILHEAAVRGNSWSTVRIQN